MGAADPRGVFDPVLGDAARIPIRFDNAPGSGGSAYQDGFYGTSGPTSRWRSATG